MNKKTLMIGAAVLLVLVAILSIAFWPQPAVEEEEPVVEQPVEEPEKEPAPPVAQPTGRMGAWLDEIVAVVADHNLAIPQIEAGDLHAFADDVTDPELYARVVEHPEVGYEKLFGVFSELSLNPAGTPEEPYFRNGKLNPFAVPRIREAMNWLVDRNYVAEEIYGGMAIPRFFAIHPAFPDYARYIDVARRLELYYAYNPERAKQVVTEEMTKLGAELVDGIWNYGGEPVEIILLIRVEDARLPLGQYMTRQMQTLGFKTTELLKTSAEAAPLWLRGDPYDGSFHIYTGGWIATSIARDQGDEFNFYYTNRGLPNPLWQATKPSAEFYELADRLARNDFADLEERESMFERALELSMQDSHRIFVVNSVGFMPRSEHFAVAGDLAGGISGAYLWALTSRLEDPATGEPIEGGTATIAMPDLLTDPWNPVAGSNWIFDNMFIRATADFGTLWDPFTGLAHPQRIERAEISVVEGTPVGVTHDWVDLQFEPASIEVPADAWVDWDPVTQEFITKEQASAQEGWDAARATANVRVRIHYPENLFDTVKWHDGTPIDIADFVMGMILSFDRAKEQSSIYDASAVPAFSTFMDHFRGVRIISENPLVIESYTNTALLDAEVIAAGWTWFPSMTFPYAQGTGAWHNITLGILAEQNKELAFSTTKAEELQIEWMSYIAGPSLPILERHLSEAQAQGFIPFEPTLSQFITAEEAEARYDALSAWFEDKGHFLIGTGPFYLEAAHPIERIVHLRRFADFPDPASKWVGFAAPRIADLEVTGPAVVTAGSEASFDVDVTFKGEPYPVADVDFVTYLVLDANGEIVHVGEAEAVSDGLWRVVLSSDLTDGLVAGSTRLEVVVSPNVVAIPSFSTATFVLLP